LIRFYINFRPCRVTRTVCFSDITTTHAGLCRDGNFPNPFNPVTNIDFDIPVSAFVSLKIFDQLGREVATIVSENLQAGSYRMQWDGSKFGSGTCFTKLESGSKMITKRMMLKN